MDRLYEQTRLRYATSHKKDRGPIGTGEGMSPFRKTVSFKEEKEISWFQRLFSDQNRHVDEASDSDFATAVAAATYVVNSLGEDSLNRKVKTAGLQTSLSKNKSRKDENIPKKTDIGSISRWFSSKDAKENRGAIGSKRFADEQGNVSEHTSIIVKAPTSRASSGKLRLTNSSHTDTRADAWEKAELAKVQKRYDEMYSTIGQWENKKKIKAKRRLDQKEVELQENRAEAMAKYRGKTGKIDKIAAEARSAANEKKTKDEAAIRKKANEIRKTGNVPHSYCCF